MKKNLVYAVAACLSLTLFPLLSSGADIKPASVLVANKPAEPVDSSEVKTLLLRLDEIKGMDKSDLKSTEKKALRKEVKTIDKQLTGPGVYISASTIIIVLLLIIIF